MATQKLALAVQYFQSSLSLAQAQSWIKNQSPDQLNSNKILTTALVHPSQYPTEEEPTLDNYIKTSMDLLRCVDADFPQLFARLESWLTQS